MSWNFSAIGAPKAVAAKARQAIEIGYKCQEPEEGFRVTVLKLVAEACENGFSDKFAVQVDASGSQSTSYGESQAINIDSNQMNLQITPIYWFVKE
jgi:hypothetical protein